MAPDGFVFGLLKVFVLLGHTYVDHQGARNGTNSCSYYNEENETSQKPFTIVVEGSVGCGKSTLVNIFKNVDGVMAVQEPVNRWENVNGTNLLDLLFKDPKRWGGTFQLESTLTRLQDALKDPVDGNGNEANIRVMERSIYSERYCFLEFMKRNKVLEDVEVALMDEWFKFASKHWVDKVKPDLIIYLRTSTDILVDRIKRRGREEEQNVDISFVSGVNKLHDDWLYYRNSSFPVPAPVLVMDARKSKEQFLIDAKKNVSKRIPKDILPKNLF